MNGACNSIFFGQITLNYKVNFKNFQTKLCTLYGQGAQWLSGTVLDFRSRGCGFKLHRHHCVVVFKQDTFILA